MSILMRGVRVDVDRKNSNTSSMTSIPLDGITVFMIASFGDSATADFFNGVVSSKTRRFQGIAKAALTKLSILAYARTLGDLAFPPSNNLEALKGNLKDINTICFIKF